MNKLTRIDSVLLANQKDKAWQQFSEQHQEFAHEIEAIANNSVDDFKTAITLSDFILSSAIASPKLITDLFVSNEVFQLGVPDYEALLKDWLKECATEIELHRLLRLFRRKHMVAIAFADMVLHVDLKVSLARLSNLADALILGARDWLADSCVEKWGNPCNANGDILPLLIYGMGKLGGKELNFSSDIDLIFVYPESGETQGGNRVLDNHTFFTRLAQKLIAALHQPTADGFVYRVDMRLRPFGDSGPLVLSFNAMEDYYQDQGRDWERYAMLKARLIGQGEYHGKLSSLLRPFVFRRYIDFSVIDSLRRMKLMISQEVRRKQLKNNIKLGAGGIREIEFIVQVFQLIRGGRTPELQERNLLSVLPRLVEYNAISDKTREKLESAYHYLRRLENLIQALNDQQTQTLPENELDQARLLAVFNAGNYADWFALLDATNKVMASVHQEFGLIIGEEAPNQESEDPHWVALWDSQWSKEESQEWILSKQPSWPAEQLSAITTHFKQDIDKRSIGLRGRQVLDKLMPRVFVHLSEVDGGAEALERLIWILKKIITRTAYLELLYENQGALIHLVKLCGASHWIAEHVAKYPIILDELIDPKLLNNPPELSSYAQELRQHMLRVPEDDIEMQMESLRQFKQAQQLRIASADVVGVLPITKVSDHLTALAEALIDEVVNQAWQQMVTRHGKPQSLEAQEKGFVVVGYGKLGGIELGYSSDLDLVFIHDRDLNEYTDGDKAISASQFYGKLAQKIMHIFNTRMSSGQLYELDMRLRPSGNSGVLVVSIETFAEYQMIEAWTWEHQALVRARAVYGSNELVERFNSIRLQVIASQREECALKEEVIKMRDKMRRHLDKSQGSMLDIKQGAGGLVDIEFLVQYLILKLANKYPKLSLFSDNLRMLESLANVGVITYEEQDLLSSRYCQLRDFAHGQSLQNTSSLMSKASFEQGSEPITAILLKYLGQDFNLPIT